jgi:hypothetical protein
VALALAASGATVGVVARDPIRGQDARNAIAAATGNSDLSNESDDRQMVT